MSVDPKFIAALEPLVRRVRTDATAIWTPDKGMLWTREPLTERTLAKHLNGGPARGVCPIQAGSDTTMVAVLDLDSHKGEVSWDGMAEAAERVTASLVMAGMIPNPWRSRGGNGMHLIVLWDEPQDAYSVRAELADALHDAGFKPGTGGIGKGQIEVFPKQSSVAADGFGNQFILPLAGKSEPLVPALGYEPGGREMALQLPWLSSAPVARREKPAPATSVSVSGTPGQAERALLAIPNDLDDRDEWFSLMCSAKEAGVDKEVARAWTAQHPSYREDGFDGPWDSIEVGKAAGVPASYLFSLAEQHGWDELIVQEFEVVEPVSAGMGPASEPWPVFTRHPKTGAIEPTASNAAAALAHSEFCGWQLGWDEFMGRRTIAQHGGTQWREFKDSDYFLLRQALEGRGFAKPSQELVREAVRFVSEKHNYDSAITWARSLRWDGVPRVEMFLTRYMGVQDNAYHRSVSLYLWTALAGRCLVPGIKADMVPVFIGEQGSGKTTMVESLAPTPEAFVELNLGNRNEEQMSRQLRGKLVGEIAELRGLAGRDAEDIKAWITRRFEEIRALYSEFHSVYWRRLVMIGTGNKEEFLDDETGERRWLPVRVGKSDIELLLADRNQLWAEAVALFDHGGVQWHQAQLLAVGEHNAFKVHDSWVDRVESWLADGGLGGPAPGQTRFTMREVLMGALLFADSQISKAVEMRMARVLTTLGFAKVVRWEQGKNRKKWERAI